MDRTPTENGDIIRALHNLLSCISHWEIHGKAHVWQPDTIQQAHALIQALHAADSI